MNKDNPHVSLYLLNTALLSTHEIDSAFWKEWELFGLPGGIQVFLVLNLLLLLAVLYGFGQLLRGARSGQMFALLLATNVLADQSFISTPAIAGGDLLIPVLVLVIAAVAVAVTLVMMRRKGKMVEKPIEVGKAAAEPLAPQVAPKEPPKDMTP